ncbi:MAG: hypothetical protein L0338_22130 [Acidobacteria bacterium]|nr:hypothetical protein [Acidobacteriota bacterium]
MIDLTLWLRHRVCRLDEVPERDVLGRTPAPMFLNRDITNSGMHSLWVQAKVLF